MTLRLLKSLRITARKDQGPKTACSSSPAARFLSPHWQVFGRAPDWIGRSTLLVAMVVGCGLANGQQYAEPSPQSEGVQNMLPPTSNHWQRDAMQMMQPPSQMSVSSASPGPAPNNTYDVPRMASASQQGLPGQANSFAQPIAGQAPQPMPSYLPPVHVSPTPRQNEGQFGYEVPSSNQYDPRRQNEQVFDNTTPTKFTRKSGPLSQLRRAQLSDQSLIHRGPGLQDRISELISSSREPSGDAQPRDPEPQPIGRQPRLQQPSMQRPDMQRSNMQRPMAAAAQIPLPFAMKVPPNARPLGEAPRSRQHQRISNVGS